MSPAKFKINIGIIRYFFSAGILIFAAYLYTEGHIAFLILLGPPIHLASFIAGVVEKTLGLRITNLDLAVLLPVTMVYFCFTGFLIKQLLHEKPLRRYLTLTGLIGFLIYLHVISWQSLSAYLGRV